MPSIFDVSNSPTMARFMADTTSEDCAVLSHVGAGKTSALVVKAQKLALIQPPADDGGRYTRQLFMRGTHNQLIRSTIKTFTHWIPADICPLRLSAPISGKITALPLNDQNQHFPDYLIKAGKKFPYLLGARWNPVTEELEGGRDVSGWLIGDVFPQGTKLFAEYEFMGLDNLNYQADLLGMELSHAHADEPDSFSRLDQVLPEVKSRMGRYPAASTSILPFSQMNFAYNPPPKGSFLHKYFDPKNEKLGRRLYRVQPPLLMVPDKEDPKNAYKAKFIRNPDAEGVEHQPLGFQYWERDLEANRHDLAKIQRRILGEYTDGGSGGDVIHPTFRMDKHVSKESLVASRSKVLFASFDHGMSGAMVIAQVDNGGIRVIEEMSAQGIPAHEFVRHHAVPHLNTQYRGYDIVCTGDPAGKWSADSKDSPFSILEDLGFLVDADQSNDPDARWSAVNYFLMYDNGMLISPDCEKLIEGFDGLYTFKRRMDGTSTGQADKTKHHSAYQDCVQAICQLVHGGYESAASGVLGTERYGNVTDNLEEEEDSFLWA